MDMLPQNNSTIQGSHEKTHLTEHWKGRLYGQKFEVEYELGNLLRAKLKKGDTIEPKQEEELVAAFRSDGFKIINKTIDKKASQEAFYHC